jgi:hypothetical protein
MPRFVNLGRVTVSVIDAGDGSATERFVDVLVENGAAPVGASTDAAADFRIVIRATPTTTEDRLREAALEEGADLVLGSARPVFAELFGSTCARWVNS